MDAGRPEMTSRRKGWVDSLWVGCFLAGVFLPLAARPLEPDRNLSGAERRQLARFPQLAWTWSAVARFPGRLDAWYQDHFGLRYPLIRLYSRLWVQGLGLSSSARVVLGKEGWLFYNGQAIRDGDPLSDYRGARLLSDAEVEMWRWRIQDLHDWLEARGIHFFLVVAPGKGLVYPEYLPDRLNRVGPVAPLDQVAAHLRAFTPVPLLDPRPLLNEVKRTGPAYFRTDTHWNPSGAFAVYQELARLLATRLPGLRPLEETAVQRDVRSYGGDLAQMLTLEDVLQEEAPFVTLRAPRAQRSTREERYLADIETRMDDPALPSAVVFRDSMGNALMPFLAEHFQRAVFRWYDAGLDYRLIERVQPDVVILEIGDLLFRKQIRYSTRIVADNTERRFHDPAGRARVLASGLDDAAGVDRSGPLPPGEGRSVRKQGAPVSLPLPAIPEVNEWLPLIRIVLNAPGDGTVKLHWSSGPLESGEGEAGEEGSVSGTVKAGDNTLYLTLRNPTATGPLRLEFTGANGDYLLREYEVRGIPRFAEP
jgi:alginate O-acetyltransferase complex protein AlgJ